MLASLTVMLMLGTASAYGGSRCLDPNPGYSSESCENNECKISSGQGDRRRARVGASFCLGGLYKNVWYQTTTTESQCNATPAANIFGSIMADFNEDSGAHVTDADREKQKAGQCFSLSNMQPTQWDPNGQSKMHTCDGVPDTKPPVTKVYKGVGCLEANFTRNESAHGQQQINGKPAPCFCNSDSSMYDVTSECMGCDVSENQCKTQDLCSKAKGKGKCTWSASACSCASGNYRKNKVCIGGAPYSVYLQGSTYAACTSFTNGPALKFPMGSSMSGCQASSGSTWDSGEQLQYKSRKENDCTGVADGGSPKRTHFNQTDCPAVALLPGANSNQRYNEENCGCMEPRNKIQSECSSCSGAACSTQDSCTMAPSGGCSWNAAATSAQCSCSSRTYRSRNQCWDGKAADLIFDNVDQTKCATGDAASVTVAKVSDVSDDSQWTNCRENWDKSGAKENATHRMDMSCAGVANGQSPKVVYYSDGNCTNVVLSEALSESYGGNDICSCQMYNGCQAGTTFEKYICAGADSDATSAPVIAVEYSDGACKTATGVNRTLTSLTDAANPGVCTAWPPIALKPNYDMSLVLKCLATNQAVTHYASDRINRDVLAPSCPTPLTSADHVGLVDSCFCKDELMFNAIALRTNVQVSGDLTMTVSDVTAAVADVTFKKIVKTSIAETAGVNPENIVNLELTAARRLQATSAAPRKLAAGSVKASYIIVVPKTLEVTMKAALTSATPAALTTKITAKVTSASLSFTATVTAKSAPASAPATVAVSSSGTIAAAGISADGQPKGAAGASGVTYCHSISGAMLFTVTYIAMAFTNADTLD